MPQKLNKRDKSGKLIYSIDPKKHRVNYFITKESSQYKFCEKVLLIGFDYLPNGFYTRKGYGLSGVGNYLLQPLSNKFGKKVSLNIIANGSNTLSKKKTKIAITLLHSDLVELNENVKIIKHQKNQQISTEVSRVLGKSFPKYFPRSKSIGDKYIGGSISKLISQKQVMDGLTYDDHQKLEKFLPQYLSRMEGTLRAKKKLKVIFDTVDAGKKVYLSKVVEEYSKKLGQSLQSESAWQEFLSSHILLLRTSYAHVLEKKNISLQGKFPDFILVDPYGYIDLYEIKTPNTTLLHYDSSRNNYYWSSELSKAISQVENYISQIERHNDALTKDIRDAKNLDISIVRPRGYIIAGMRTQLAKKKMEDDFRILNESLKNIDVLLYDDLLDILKSFNEKVN
jgi:hypothetical protein